MLKIQGTLGDMPDLPGKYYKDETPISAQELAKYFPMLVLPKPDSPVYFRLNPSLVVTDQFQQVNNPASIRLSTKMRVNYGPHSFHLTYDTGKGGPAKTRVILENVDMKYDDSKFEEALFVAMFPKCQQSPIAGPRWLYTAYNPAAEKMVRYEQDVRKNQLQTDILVNLPWLSLQLRAAGLVIKGESVRPALREGEVSTRSALIVLLNKYPDDFFKEWEKPQTQVQGMLWQALDTGLIVRGAEGQRKILRFADVLGGRRITYLSGGNEYQQLLAATQVDDSIVRALQQYYDQQAAAPKVTADPNINLSADEQRRLADLEIIEDAKALNLISYNSNTMTVYLKNAKNAINPLSSFSLEQLKEVNGRWEQALQIIFVKDKTRRQAVQAGLRWAKDKMQDKTIHPETEDEV